jgi:hypothetical protein
MNDEETELLTLLHQHFSDDDLKDMERQMLAAIDSSTMAACVRLLAGGLNRPELLDWLAALRNRLPEQDYEMIVKSAVAPGVSQETFDALVKAGLIETDSGSSPGPVIGSSLMWRSGSRNPQSLAH